ncbi:DUF5696 domain-containing protein [Alkalihalobacillus sp. 1P02AB]|uniref:DUF5696 domain-containing protein n=1 Tax=Alkalihalobacillus sp. 1P02AB TaxID=3132260 RepID=UPI0039A4B247
MFKKWRWLLLVIMIVFPVQVLAALSDDDPETEVSEIQEELQNEALRYSSNQFTLPEEEVEEWSEGEFDLTGYDFVTENEQLQLYVESDSLAIKVVDKRTGYVWSSGIQADHEFNLNNTWTSLARSAVTIQYIDCRGNIQSESILTNEVEVNIDREIDGFSAIIPFDAGITVRLEVALTDDGLELLIPYETITEEDNQLVMLRLYPFLGAVHQNEVNGYMFIPDGSGALIRFQDGNLGALSPYQAFVYGKDEAFKRTPQSSTTRTNPRQQVSMPVYGVVHGANQNGFVSLIEEGSEFSEIIAFPSGVSTDFNWVTSQYHYRYEYYQPTSQSMSGFNAYQEDMNQFDIKQQIKFLVEEEANYVGMAHVYQDYLIQEGNLAKQKDEVDIRLEFLGGEVKTGLLWNSIYPMTEVAKLPEYVERLKAQDVENMHLVYRGWTKGGISGTLPQKFPVDRKLGGKQDVLEVTEYMDEQQIPFYFQTDYSSAHANASGYSGRTDVARKMNAETITVNSGEERYFILNPERSLKMAQEDVSDFNEHNISRLAIEQSAQILFSNYAGQTHSTRAEMKETYEQMFEELQAGVGPLALYQPFDYMWSHMERYLDIPMYSSNYRYVTDTVPFIQIVLKGYVPYYGPHSNFHFNSEEELLRMIEFGAYPSFYLTTEPSHLLMHTPSKSLYTSQYNDWEKGIVYQYQMVKDSLGEVEGESIISRTVHESGVVEVGYSNDKSIFVNYTNEPYVVDEVEIEIEARGFKVIDWGIQS